MSLPAARRATATETGDSGVTDDRLRLMFTCCHPALPLEARVALTLRTLAGLTTAEIARAFLASEPTMAKRLVRAKQKIQHAGIPYRVPPAHLLPERIAGRARRAVPAVQRGLLGHGGRRPGPAEPVRRGDPAGPGAGPADAGRAGGGGPAGADAAARRAPGRAAGRGWRPGHAGGPGPRRGGTRAEIGEGVSILEAALRRGPARARTRCRRPSPPATPPRPPPPTPTGRRSRRCTSSSSVPAHAGGGAEPRRRGGHGPAGRRPACRWWRPWRRRGSWPAITCSPRPGPTCCAVSAASPKRPPRTPRRWSWPAPTPSAAYLARRLAETGGPG